MVKSKLFKVKCQQIKKPFTTLIKLLKKSYNKNSKSINNLISGNKINPNFMNMLTHFPGSSMTYCSATELPLHKCLEPKTQIHQHLINIFHWPSKEFQKHSNWYQGPALLFQALQQEFKQYSNSIKKKKCKWKSQKTSISYVSTNHLKTWHLISEMGLFNCVKHSTKAKGWHK